MENKTKSKILLAEDDPNLGTLLSEYLSLKGYSTTLTRNGQEAFDAFFKNNFNLCIFDVMMPLKDGFTLAKEIRKHNDEIPILFLTAKSLKEDTLEGFKSGADDYLTKPFSMEELLYRIKALLKRTQNQTKEPEQTFFEIGKFHFDYNKQLLKTAQSEQKLTSKENELLRLLCLSQNGILDRTFALKKIWEDDSYFNARSMDVYIAKLRKYLKADPQVEIINIHGKGFKLLIN